MTAPGYIVQGKGDRASIYSAAHGAGRAMSRTQAKRTLNKRMVGDHISGSGDEVIGSGFR
jgi:tRNA-splicing ligase RtcB